MKRRRVLTLAAAVAAVCAFTAKFAAPQPAEWPALARYEAMPIPSDNPMTPAKVALGRGGAMLSTRSRSLSSFG